MWAFTFLQRAVREVSGDVPDHAAWAAADSQKEGAEKKALSKLNGE